MSDFDDLKKAAVRSGEGIEGSHFFLSLYTKNYKDDPFCALQLGIAVMLDKPIGLLVPTDVEVVENIRRLARGIEYYDPDDKGSIKKAAERLTSQLKVFLDGKDD